MADVNRGNRPLSPHLQIYRLPLVAKISIMTRITGVGMMAGGILVIWWFVAGAYSPGYFAVADGLLTSWFGKLVLIGSLWALWFHFANGIRHFFFDLGKGFDLPVVARSNWYVIGASVVLTVLTLMLV
ncbi:MAG: succinate dehydrogenase, cytochrome b556 subunit [Rhodobacter sp.]|uniref:succinate dehydrogenase, cytochrome b556 subunit n=1 Tax=Pararhodobacter sp. TaxID=2127056 RepID=UPI001D4CEC90|nr:succinate dehydrogenase, cytochrome b556 subunit [Pararhodobacter sp.]MCB1345373.1 succinate dehydrogenase, cytochrome b556 subunit [Paracoccaceae bacterium]MCB1408096.1 succinate dehydrogenase, cytochrome b556 subunit [Paracoccaceae bacterium]MCC0072616.1 succinate dehydrogenase, cytochrome b556 subunit [Rhodobacter sp.]HPD92691.1 succinate dehydrogenase, cytochrome b556 subunit [Pararhodobacter sp.]